MLTPRPRVHNFHRKPPQRASAAALHAARVHAQQFVGRHKRAFRHTLVRATRAHTHSLTIAHTRVRTHPHTQTHMHTKTHTHIRSAFVHARCTVRGSQRCMKVPGRRSLRKARVAPHLRRLCPVLGPPRPHRFYSDARHARTRHPRNTGNAMRNSARGHS